MSARRVAGFAFGYGLLAVAVVAVANALRLVVLGAVGSIVVTDAVFFVMGNLGGALVVGTAGYVVLQRVRRTGGGYGVDLDWGRVLGR